MSRCKNGVIEQTYILSVDVGTTTIRCHIYDSAAKVRGTSSRKVELLYPNPGWVELDPDVLWSQFVSVVKEAVEASGLHMRQMCALGISTQRATFTTWNRKTGRPFHNFISWQDLRAADLVKSWNKSCLLKTINGFSKVLYFLSRRKRFLAASAHSFTTQHISLRLVWILQNLKEVQQAAAEGNCCFGTIDTWLLYNLTKGSVHATDFSNASSTGIYDTYQMCWSHFFSSILSIPLSVFPAVVDTSFYFGQSDSSIFGVAIPITSVVADQQAAMFGECCFDVGDVKITMGTGTFIDINTGRKPHASVSGLYPLVGWKIGKELVLLAEGNAADTGTAIKWAEKLGLFSDPLETEMMAKSVPDADGVCFVPSFSGLQAPLNDPHACACFLGLKPSTSKNHLVRAILESVAFRNKQLYDTMLRETRVPVTTIRADGGVCNNNFIMQLSADLLNQKIYKSEFVDMSSLGAAFLAGLAAGFWASREELKMLRNAAKIFKPQKINGDYEEVMCTWEKAIRRSLDWYN